jgi:hypothetical protein
MTLPHAAQPFEKGGARARRPNARWRAAVAIAGLVIAGIAAGAEPAVAQTSNPPAGPRPFASGMLASISGSTLQLQNAGGTATVVVNKSTRFTQTKTAALSDITVGDCVRVTGTGSTATGVEATNISVSKPSSGSCTLGSRAEFGANRPRANGSFDGRGGAGTNAAGPPPGARDGNGGSRPANFAVAFGTVKHISGSTFTVKAQTFATPATTKPSGSKPKVKTQNVNVTASDTATITQTASATQKDLQVGSCVTANGTTDSVGTVTAQRVTISQPQKGACPAFGFGRFGRGPGAGANGQATA